MEKGGDILAEKIKFDRQHNAIKPTLVLMTKGGTKLGTLPACDVTFRTSMREYSEFSFNIYKGMCKDITIWNKLVDFKLLWVVEWNKLYELKINLTESSELVKNVEARSLGESELSQINLYGIEINTENDIARDDYKVTVLYDGDDEKASLLHRIMEKVPHYKIASVDSTIANIQRTFSFDGKSIYDSFQEIAEEIQCLFIINCYLDSETGKIKREINVRDLLSYCNDCKERGDFTEKCSKCGETNITRGYGKETPIFISTENLADEITYKVDSDSVKNCFKLEAGDDLMTATVVNCNPNGSSYIWHFSDDMKADMSDELKEKLAKYDGEYQKWQSGEIGLSTDKYNGLVEKYNGLVTEDYGENHEKITSPIAGYPSLMQAEYNVIDFELYLKSGFMPSPTMRTPTAEEQINAIKTKFSGNFQVAVKSLSSITKSTAESYILQIAKMVINKIYKIVIEDGGRLELNKWIGSFKITNISNQDDIATSGSINISLTADEAEYTRQRIEQVLQKKVSRDDSAMGVTDLFGRTDSDSGSDNFKYDELDFKGQLYKYGLARLQSFHDACQACLDIMIEQGVAADTGSEIYKNIYFPFWNRLSWIEAEIKTREGEISTVESLRNEIESKQSEIQKGLNLQKYLGEGLWKELMSYRREDTYSNSNYISDGLSNKDLYRNAKDFISVANRELYKSSVQQHTITATLKNLLFMKEFAPIVNNFETGNWIRIKADGTLYRLRLLEYEIDFEDSENIAVTFSDVTNTKDGYSDIESILNQASSMASSYDYVERQSRVGKSTREIVDGWVDKGLSLTTQKIINDADNQSITFDSNGLLCRKFDPITDTFFPNQVKIINKGLYVTNDNWKTARAGIGAFTYFDPSKNKVVQSYGVIADTIVGKIILSEKVGIYNSNNSVSIDKDGFVITVPSTSNSENVFKIKKTQSDGSVKNLLYVDTNGDLNIEGKVTATSGSFTGSITANGGSIGGFTIGTDELAGRMYCGTPVNPSFLLCPGGASYTINSQTNTYAMTIGNKFGVTTEGGLYAKDVNISGTIKTSSITNGTYGEGSIGFSLTSNGVLSASGATIRGTIYASSGKFIGEVEASKFKLTGGATISGYATTDSVTTAQTTADNAQTTANNAIQKGIEYQTSDGKTFFQVTGNGKLTVKDGEFTGKITASQGSIAGWDISESQLEKEAINKDGTHSLMGLSPTYGLIATEYKTDSNETITNNRTIFHLSTDYFFAGSKDKEITGTGLDRIKNLVASLAPNDANFCISLRHEYPWAQIGGWNIGKGEMRTKNEETGKFISDKYKEDYVICRSDGNIQVGMKCIDGDNSYANFYVVKKDNNAESFKDAVAVFSVSNIGNIYARSLTQSSDRRLKNTIAELDNSSDKFFYKLKPVTFKFNNAEKFSIGFIAQDVQKSLADSGYAVEQFSIVQKGEDGYFSMDYSQLTAINTHMIQTAIRENEKLKERIARLEEKILALTA